MSWSIHQRTDTLSILRNRRGRQNILTRQLMCWYAETFLRQIGKTMLHHAQLRQILHHITVLYKL